MTPHAILLVCAPDSPLLADGPCGARAPSVHYAPVHGSLVELACHGLLAMWSPAPTDQSDGCYVCPICHREAPESEAVRHAWVVLRGGSRPRGFVVALPLWWDGKLVPEGVDRARRVWRPTVADKDSWLVISPTDLAHALVRQGDGSRVVLLDLVDGRLLERP